MERKKTGWVAKNQVSSQKHAHSSFVLLRHHTYAESWIETVKNDGGSRRGDLEENTEVDMRNKRSKRGTKFVTDE